MVKASKDANDESSTDTENERAGNDDSMSKVTPKCPHIIKSIDFTKVKKYIKQNGFSSSCTECDKMKTEVPLAEDGTQQEEEDGTDKSLWMCLRCGLQFCGRFVNKHAVAHYEVSHSYDETQCTFLCVLYFVRFVEGAQRYARVDRKHDDIHDLVLQL